MIKKIFKKKKHKNVFGYDIGKPRITFKGYYLIFLYVALPIIIFGGIIDFLIMLISGKCLGIWCVLQS